MARRIASATGHAIFEYRNIPDRVFPEGILFLKNSNDMYYKSMEVLRDKLMDRFNSVDFDQVRRDAGLFVFDNEDLSFYSRELFIQMMDRIM